MLSRFRFLKPARRPPERRAWVEIDDTCTTIRGSVHYPSRPPIRFDSWPELATALHLGATGVAREVESSGLPLRRARRVRTVVFTDVVGSTGLLAGIGDERWAALWAELDDLVGALTRRFDGEVFKSLGDGHMIAFADANAAASFGSALQRKLMGRGTFGTPVTLRLGMHTGDVIQTGNDLHGRTVHIAARIAALARSGDILCSGAIRNALEADRQWTFEPPQSVTLRGLNQPHIVAALRWHVGATGRRPSTPRFRVTTSWARATAAR